MEDKYPLNVDDMSKVSGGLNVRAGSIFTGYDITVYDSCGSAVSLKELSEGGFMDENTGEEFTATPTGLYYGSNGTTLYSDYDMFFRE